MKHLLLVVLLAGFGPCGSEKKSEPVAAGSAAPAGSATAPAGSAGAPGADVANGDVPACKVMTRAEAETWAGHSLGDADGRPMPQGSDCKFRVKKPYSAVIITFYSKDGASVLDQQKKAGMFGKAGATDIAGVGTAATRSEDGSTVGVVANDKLAFVTCVSCDALSPAKAEAAAKAIASHM
ncbi:MAG: hypothetical protein QM831_44390 [Kofleriaceae bacterium]